MPTVKANGKTFTFPEGTTPEQIGEGIDEYFAANPVNLAPVEPTEPKAQAPEGRSLLKAGVQNAGRAVSAVAGSVADSAAFADDVMRGGVERATDLVRAALSKDTYSQTREKRKKFQAENPEFRPAQALQDVVGAEAIRQVSSKISSALGFEPEAPETALGQITSEAMDFVGPGGYRKAGEKGFKAVGTAAKQLAKDTATGAAVGQAVEAGGLPGAIAALLGIGGAKKIAKGANDALNPTRRAEEILVKDLQQSIGGAEDSQRVAANLDKTLGELKVKGIAAPDTASITTNQTLSSLGDQAAKSINNADIVQKRQGYYRSIADQWSKFRGKPEGTEKLTAASKNQQNRLMAPEEGKLYEIERSIEELKNVESPVNTDLLEMKSSSTSRSMSLTQALKDSRKTGKEMADLLYDAVPGKAKVTPQDFASAILNPLSNKDMDPGLLDELNDSPYVKELVEKASTVEKRGGTTVEFMTYLRRQLSKDLTKEIKGLEKTDNLAVRDYLGQAIRNIDEVLSNHPEVGKAYKQANAYYNQIYASTFKDNKFGSLVSGATADEARTMDKLLGDHTRTRQAVKQFVMTGNAEGLDLLKEGFIAQNSEKFLDKNGVLSVEKLDTFLTKNREYINEIPGLDKSLDELRSMASEIRQTEGARSAALQEMGAQLTKAKDDYKLALDKTQTDKIVAAGLDVGGTRNRIREGLVDPAEIIQLRSGLPEDAFSQYRRMYIREATGRDLRVTDQTLSSQVPALKSELEYHNQNLRALYRDQPQKVKDLEFMQKRFMELMPTTANFTLRDPDFARKLGDLTKTATTPALGLMHGNMAGAFVKRAVSLVYSGEHRKELMHRILFDPEFASIVLKKEFDIRTGTEKLKDYFKQNGVKLSSGIERELEEDD